MPITDRWEPVSIKPPIKWLGKARGACRTGCACMGGMGGCGALTVGSATVLKTMSKPYVADLSKGFCGVSTSVSTLDRSERGLQLACNR